MTTLTDYAPDDDGGSNRACGRFKGAKHFLLIASLSAIVDNNDADDDDYYCIK